MEILYYISIFYIPLNTYYKLYKIIFGSILKPIL